ncbi:MAG: hypothetical protein WBB36_07390 [Chitinophagales bacterium]
MFKPGLVVAFVLLLTLLSGVSHVKAQTSSTEFWPESDNWLKLTKQWRLSMFFSLSKNIETKDREGNYIAQIDYVFGKTHSLHSIRLYDDNRAQTLKPFMIRPGYLGGTSIGDEGQNYNSIYAFNLILHLYFETKKAKQSAELFEEPPTQFEIVANGESITNQA